ncbi:hypothetical protein MINTMi27_14800 [Mycobacterium intracellulare]|uniref:hypothetical protein n=1 Tax=Mycobacterium intracellulare TaxID=1767 RepID=UPI00192894D9|nr:hypothetical protein [Mycobacterium intracellulare]BCP41387.1 hypothetical protein MINTMi27_14800 [Mycobacterium intracellulare]
MELADLIAKVSTQIKGRDELMFQILSMIHPQLALSFRRGLAEVDEEIEKLLGG